MDVVALISACYASPRFPGKPLARQTGKYLIQHLWGGASERAPWRCRWPEGRDAE
jgi:CMP-2-keto-3-deoxyoctulosonic acid synthetase